MQSTANQWNGPLFLFVCLFVLFVFFFFLFTWHRPFKANLKIGIKKNHHGKKMKNESLLNC